MGDIEGRERESSDPAMREVERQAAEYDAYYDSYEVIERTPVRDLDARRASMARPPAGSFFKSLGDLIRTGLGLPPPSPAWMREAVNPKINIHLNGVDVDVVAVAGRRLWYRVPERVGNRVERVLKSAELTDAVLAHNFAELPLSELRPTENGLSATRLEAAREFLDEPVRVFPHTLPNGRTEYYVLNGHHRLLAAHEAGETTVRVQFVHRYGYENVMNKIFAAEAKRFPVPPDVSRLEVDPLRVDDYEGGPPGDPIFEPHYYYGKSFYDGLPAGGQVVDGVAFYRRLDLEGRSFPTMDGGELSFTGRVLGQDAEATQHEAVLKTPDGVSRMVSVQIRDHAWDPIEAERLSSDEVVAREAASGREGYHGFALIDGMTGIITDPVSRFGWRDRSLISAPEYGPHYQKPQVFYLFLPQHGRVENLPNGRNVKYFPVPVGVLGSTVPVQGISGVPGEGETVSFTGRVYGQGTYATVYEAVWSRPGEADRTVAIKVFERGYATEADRQQAFDREAGVLNTLAETGGITGLEFLGTVSVKGLPGLVMEVAPGTRWTEVEPFWINETTFQDVRRMFEAFDLAGMDCFDFQVHVAADGHAFFIDAGGLVPKGSSPHQPVELEDALRMLSEIRGEPAP